MPKRKITNPFQNLSASLVAVFHGAQFDVEESVLVVNERTGAVRELDIVVKHRKKPNERLLIECRDHRRRQDVQWLDALEGKARRLKFPHVVAVSSSGFTKPAIREGRERGISTLHLREAESLDWAEWRFGLEKFGLQFHSNPIVRDIQFVVRAGSPIPTNVTRNSVVLLNAKRKSKIRLVDWIAGFEGDPRRREQFPKPPESNSIQHYRYEEPCDPEIGFVVEPSVHAYALEKVVVAVDRINADYQVPLRHYRLGTERFHVGHFDFFGHPYRLVLHERTDRKLQMLYEPVEKVPKRYLPAAFTLERSELVVETKESGAIVCPELPASKPVIHLTDASETLPPLARSKRTGDGARNRRTRAGSKQKRQK